MKNLGLKSLSLLIALLLYLFVHSQSNISQRSFGAPVELLGLPASKMVLLPVSLQAQVTIRGPSFIVDDVWRSAPAFEVLLPSDVGGRYEVILSEDTLGLSPGVEVVKIEPSAIQLILDDRVEKSVPVKIDTRGHLPDTVRMVGSTSNPGTVLLNGPASEIEDIDQVETYPLNLAQLTQSSQTELQLRNPWRYVRLRPGRVSVRTEVTVISSELTFDKLPVEVRMRGGMIGTSVPNEVSVTFSGPMEMLRELPTSSVVPFVVVTKEMVAGFEEKGNVAKGEVPLKVQLPPELSLVKVVPDKVRVEVSKKK